MVFPWIPPLTVPPPRLSGAAQLGAVVFPWIPPLTVPPPPRLCLCSHSMKMGKCVVIGMQSTGEARTLEQLERDEGELTDFVSTSK